MKRKAGWWPVPTFAQGIALCALLGISGCASTRVREFPVNQQGAMQAVALALKQPMGSYNYLQLSLDVKRIEPPRWHWISYTIPGLSMDGVANFVIDTSAERSIAGVSPTTIFDASDAGAAKAIAFRDERSPGVRLAMFRHRWRADLTAVAWAWERGPVKLADLFATSGQICFPLGCVDYEDARRIYFEVPTPGTTFEDAAAGEFFEVKAETFPALLRDLKSRGVAGEVTIERRADWREANEKVLLRTVSVIEPDRLCGKMFGNRPTHSTEVCFPLADVQAIQVKDANRSPLELANDAVVFPFAVVGAAVAIMAAGAP